MEGYISGFSRYGLSHWLAVMVAKLWESSGEDNLGPRASFLSDVLKF